MSVQEARPEKTSQPLAEGLQKLTEDIHANLRVAEASPRHKAARVVGRVLFGKENIYVPFRTASKDVAALDFADKLANAALHVFKKGQRASDEVTPETESLLLGFDSEDGRDGLGLSMADGKLLVGIYHEGQDDVMEQQYYAVSDEGVKRVVGIDEELGQGIDAAGMVTAQALVDRQENLTFKNVSTLGDMNKIENAMGQFTWGELSVVAR